MTWLAGLALIVDFVLVLLLAFVGIVTNQDAGFLWLTIGLAAVAIIALAAYVSLGTDGDGEAEPEIEQPYLSALEGVPDTVAPRAHRVA